MLFLQFLYEFKVLEALHMKEKTFFNVRVLAAKLLGVQIVISLMVDHFELENVSMKHYASNYTLASKQNISQTEAKPK